MNFKERVVQLRKEKELTQEEFAKAIGFSRTAISAWEIGRNEPSYEEMIKIANFFNVSTDYLVGKSDKRKNDLEDNVKEVYLNGYQDWNEEDKKIVEILKAKYNKKK